MPRTIRLLLACLAWPVALGCTCHRSPDSGRAATSSPVSSAAASGSATPASGAQARAFGPTVAGSFYPSDPNVLRDMVRWGLQEGAGAKGKIEPGWRVVALVSPHAGYVYSGSVAGAAYGSVAGTGVRTVVVLGPSHHARDERACLLEADAYRTPIGEVPIDADLGRRLVRDGPSVLRVREDIFKPEHSVDVQIPFVKEALPGARVVPIIVPLESEAKLDALADLLHGALSGDEHSLLVASSDLSHFFEYETARRLDDEILGWIERGEAASLMAHHDERRGPCGLAPVVVAMRFVRRFGPRVRAARLDYKNSGDTRGGRGRVVGYGALAWSVPGKP
jgi:AmmeMemoRadiSam system protein B